MAVGERVEVSDRGVFEVEHVVVGQRRCGDERISAPDLAAICRDRIDDALGGVGCHGRGGGKEPASRVGNQLFEELFGVVQRLQPSRPFEKAADLARRGGVKYVELGVQGGDAPVNLVEVGTESGAVCRQVPLRVVDQPVGVADQ